MIKPSIGDFVVANGVLLFVDAVQTYNADSFVFRCIVQDEPFPKSIVYDQNGNFVQGPKEYNKTSTKKATKEEFPEIFLW